MPAFSCTGPLCMRRNHGSLSASSRSEMCFDHRGDMVRHGQQYVPLGMDTACTQCTCLNGRAEMCIAVLCTPPENCREYHQLTNKCCQFLCLDGPDQARYPAVLPNWTRQARPTATPGNVGLRLLSSAVSSFLVLALLLLLVHRVRQRRLALMLRRLQAEPGPSPADNCYFGIAPPFGAVAEPPPPYTGLIPGKPPQPPGPAEAPPSYEESLQQANQSRWYCSSTSSSTPSSGSSSIESCSSSGSWCSGTAVLKPPGTISHL